MKLRSFAAIALAIGLLSGTARAQTPTSPPPTSMSGGAKRVLITYENLTTGQGFSPSVFMSHNVSAMPLFKEGEKASFGLMRLAEEGNTGPLLVEGGMMMGKTVGMAAAGLPTPPGTKSHSVEIEVTSQHPMISGAWMLGMTNAASPGSAPWMPTG